MITYGKYMILNRFCKCCFKHKFLALATILSLLIGMIVPVYRMILDKDFVFYSDTFYYFIPTMIILVLSLIFVLVYKKNPICVKVFSSVINTLLLIVEAFYVFLFCTLISILNSDRTFSDPTEYVEALNSVNCSSCVAHFPRELPVNAKEIQLYKSQSSWHGGVDMLLKFNIDEIYINNEIKKNKYIKIENLRNSSFFYKSIVAGSGGKVKIDDFTFYVIKDKTFGSSGDIANTYSYGIGVNKDIKQIIYYFSILD